MEENKLEQKAEEKMRNFRVVNKHQGEVVVKFENVSKIYKLFSKDSKRILSMFTKRTSYKEKKAVDNISFEIHKGESVAFFGRNGAGKSTVLKMITEVTYPTEGNVMINGRVSALLELTSGFDPELTGIENIFLKGQIMGLKDSEIKELVGDIREFADLGDYIYQPVRTYSSGMRARLGFAVNININPDILIIDEALSVGDVAFRKKCVTKVNSIMKNEEVTLIFVTHSVNTAREFCNRGIVLKNGKIVLDGDIDASIEEYRRQNKK